MTNWGAYMLAKPIKVMQHLGLEFRQLSMGKKIHSRVKRLTFKKIKSPNPPMDAKLDSKTYLKICFIIFLAILTVFG